MWHQRFNFHPTRSAYITLFYNGAASCPVFYYCCRFAAECENAAWRFAVANKLNDFIRKQVRLDGRNAVTLYTINVIQLFYKTEKSSSFFATAVTFSKIAQCLHRSSTLFSLTPVAASSVTLAITFLILSLRLLPLPWEWCRKNRYNHSHPVLLKSTCAVVFE